jgi:molecular chaperone HscA
MLIPINIKTGTLADNLPKPPQNLIVGIDLGTTNSLVAYIDPNTQQPVTISDENGNNRLVPSILHFADNGSLVVGNEARPYLATQPHNTLYSVKRLMGKSYKDIAQYTDFFGYQVIDDQSESLVKIRVGNRFYTPVELSALLLKALKERAENALGQTISQAVITVPAYFNDAQRQATRDAGKLAGLDVLRIINEPTAAALAYGIGINDLIDEKNSTNTETIAVYDLGGGTFDLSILCIEDRVFEVLATNGDTFLGGDDIDRAIMNHWLQKNNIAPNSLQTDKALSQTLRIAAETAKKQLSNPDLQATTTAQTNNETANQPYDLSLSAAEFEQMVTPLIERSLVCCRQALADAKLQASDISKVIMVGGSTRIPLVKKMVGKLFNTVVYDQLNPDEVVALGAAVQADILAGNNRDMLLLDVTPLSLGIETMGGLMDVIVPRNTKIPVRASRQYTTQRDGQSGINIAVYQGERDLVKHNRKLGEFILRGIPAMPAGLPKVEILFTLDADGITRVKAQELRSGIAQAIEIKPQYGLSEEEMSLMLLEALRNAQSDMQTRALQEAINEANTLADTAERFIDKHRDLLTEAEIASTQTYIATLRQHLASQDKDLIHTHIENLNEHTRPFAERVMDMAVGAAMRGKIIE